jgi:hypothetical protein
VCELFEVFSQFEKIPLIAHKVHKTLDVMVCFFGQNEEGDSVVGSDIIKIIDVGSHELENEHDVVSLIEVGLLVFLNELHYFFLLLVFYYQFVHIHFLCNHNVLLGFLLLHTLLLSIDVLFLYLYVLVVEIYIFVDVYLRTQNV